MHAAMLQQGQAVLPSGSAQAAIPPLAAEQITLECQTSNLCSNWLRSEENLRARSAFPHCQHHLFSPAHPQSTTSHSLVGSSQELASLKPPRRNKVLGVVSGVVWSGTCGYSPGLLQVCFLPWVLPDDIWLFWRARSLDLLHHHPSLCCQLFAEVAVFMEVWEGWAWSVLSQLHHLP